MGVDSDAEVIARSLREGECFAAIFDRHFGRIHRFLEWRAGRDTADDLAGEVFRVAFERRARYDPDRASCLPWLYGIAGTLLQRQRRTWARHAGAVARDGAMSVVAGDEFTDDVVARVDATRRSEEVAALLGHLTDDERDVVLLAAWEGLSYDELADALGVPIGTVRSRLHRGRKKLRQQLGMSDEPAGDLSAARTPRCAR